MNAGDIWWGQIGSSLTLLSQIANLLKDGQSAVLQLPRFLPWREDFYEAIDLRRTALGDDRRLRRLVWKEHGDPGEMVLGELCAPQVRADYWPGQPCAEYLGKLEEIPLNQYCVWITGIRRHADLSKWIEFVSVYEAAAADSAQRAMFLLECENTAIPGSSLPQIQYRVEEYDCRVFALECAGALKNTGASLRAYQAELALHAAGGNPEFCHVLLAAGERFLHSPAETAVELNRAYRDDLWEGLSERRAAAAAWEAGVVLFFPVLERFRMRFISEHDKELFRLLPIPNGYGGFVEETCDLELGNLCYIDSFKSSVPFSEEEHEALRLCHNVRNLLAHSKPVPYAEAAELLRLAAEMNL